MKLFVIGFPKSGTTTLTHALEESGMTPAHWADETGRFIGRTIYENVLSGRNPFDSLDGYDSITQADVCLPARRTNYWPNLDFAILAKIRECYPDCIMLLNVRDPAKVVSSINRWPSLRQRIVRAQIPGLPSGMGSTDSQITNWIENHYAACRRFFAGDSKFLELDIESEEAPDVLGRALGIEIKDWGIIEPNAPSPRDVAFMNQQSRSPNIEFRAGPSSRLRRRRER